MTNATHPFCTFCKTVVNRKAQQLHPLAWQAVFGCSLSVLILQATFSPLL